MNDKADAPKANGYGKHSKLFWMGVYVAVAIVVYGLIYLLFIHKSGTTGGGFSY